MQTLIPQSAYGTARPLNKTGRVLGFGLTRLGLGLFLGGLLLAVPAFFHAGRIWFMLAWDGLLLLLVLVDAARLPRPEAFGVTRSFVDSPQLGVPTRVELGVRQESDAVVDVVMVDDLHPSLIAEPTEQRVEAFPREAALIITTLYPRERGDFALGKVFLRYSGALRLVERWAVALPLKSLETATAEPNKIFLPLLALVTGFVAGVWGPIKVWELTGSWFLCLLAGAGCIAAGYLTMRKLMKSPSFNTALAQRVRVFPAHDDSRGDTQFYLLRARQIELQKRKLRMRGVGREFDTLRDYQTGDEMRNVSWTATARRGRLVTRQFTVERSQQVWMLLDAGRLSRTGFEMRRGTPELLSETESERGNAHLLTVTQLDQATTAATMLAQVIQGSGDKFAMMSYGRSVQQALMPGAGAGHLRLLIDLLSQTKSEAAEADHLQAVARLKTMQRRRSLMVWVTELADSVGRPELVTAAAELVRRHLVVLVLLKHPELDAMAAKTPETREEMFRVAAAQEMLERRRETVLQLERQGVLIVETIAAEVGIAAVSQYLEVKAKGLL